MSHQRTWKISLIPSQSGSSATTSFDFAADAAADIEEFRIFRALDEGKYRTRRRSGISRMASQPSLAFWSTIPPLVQDNPLIEG
jgi:hypothetical protein